MTSFLWNRSILVLGILGLLVQSGCQTTEQMAVDDYIQSHLNTENGKFNEALANLNQAIEKNPKMGLAYMSRGEIYKDRGDYEMAAKDFSAVTKLEPFNFNAHYQLGLMYQYLKRFESAITAYQKAVEIKPLDPHANMNIALVYAQMNQPLRGLGYAQRAVSGDDKIPDTHGNLGVLYAQIGYSELAIEELKRAIELNSKEPQVYLNLSAEYMKLHQNIPARNVLETGSKLAPTAAVWERLATCYNFLNQFPEAQLAYEKALKLDETYYQALNGLGVVAIKQSMQATPPDLNLARQGMAYWHRSLKLEPNQPNISKLVEDYVKKTGLDKADNH